jgi:WS/DGAT/MGAT family acyltransferase
MSGIDALLWHMERDPRLRGTAVTLLVLDTSPDWGRLVERMERTSRVTPHFRDRVVEAPLGLAPPRWVTDADFDLSYHLRRAAVPPPGDLRTALDLAQAWSMSALDKERPLWEYTLLEGLADGRSALVQKVHHAMSDGVGGMEMALAFFDLEREPTDAGSMPPLPPVETAGRLDVTGDAVRRAAGRVAGGARRLPASSARWAARAARDPTTTVTDAARLAASTARLLAPITDRLSPVMTARSVNRHFDTIEVGLTALKAAAAQAGGTVNDGFLAGLCCGLSRYHRRHGSPVERLRVTVPLDIRRAGDDEGGNHITTLRYEVPAEATDVHELIGEIHRSTAAMLAEPGIESTDAIAEVLSRFPPGVISTVFGGMLCNVDFLASNVPGFPEAPYLAGARADRWYAFGPTEGAALNATLLSHGGTCCVGLNTDRAAVPDPDALTACLREGFDEVLAAPA